MRKVCVVVTARPSYARLRSVLRALALRGDVDLQVVVGASALLPHYGRVLDVLQADGLPVTDTFLSVVEGDTTRGSVQTAALSLSQCGEVFHRLAPDLVIVHADRHEVLSPAMAAAYQHIPLLHLQGGEQTGSIDDKVRHAITQLADYHCVSTVGAAARVRQARPGLPAEAIQVTGCPSLDGLDAIPASHDYDLIVLQHPVTNEAEQAGAQLQATIDAIRPFYESRVLWIWPGHDAGTDHAAAVLRRFQQTEPPHVTFRRNLPPEEFISVLKGCQVLVGNSSAGIRECAYLGVPAVNIGTRQDGRECAPNVMHCGTYEADIIAKAIWMAGGGADRSDDPQLRYLPSTLYGDGHSGERIAALAAQWAGVTRRLACVS